MKVDPYYQRQKFKQMTVVYSGIRFVRVFARFPGDGRQTTVGLLTTAIFSVFAGYFSDSISMRPALLYGDMQSIIGFSVIPGVVFQNA